MENKNTKWALAIGLIIVGVISRFLPHPPNFTAIAAVSLFAGAVLASKWLAFILPLGVMYLSDFVINNTVSRPFFPDREGMIFWADYMVWVYLGIAATVLIGMFFLKKRSPLKLIGAGIGSGLIFWLLSNFGILIQPGGYPETMSGAMACYSAAVPFLRNALMGDIIFVLLIFGIWDYVTKSSTSEVQFSTVH